VPIPVSRPCITEDDVDAVAGILRDGFVSGDAPIVAEFEKAFASAVHRKHGVAVSNGSVALHALDLEVGDEVISEFHNCLVPVCSTAHQGNTDIHRC